MVALPAAGTVSWGVQALMPTFVTAETMARAGANKITYEYIEVHIDTNLRVFRHMLVKVMSCNELEINDIVKKVNFGPT